MKTVSLTAWERLKLIEYLKNPDQRGGLEFLVRASKLFKILELSKDEKKKVDWTDEPTFLACPNCQTRIQTSEDGAGRWEDAQHEFELQFEDADFELLHGATTWPGWPASMATLIVPMLRKLED